MTDAELLDALRAASQGDVNHDRWDDLCELGLVGSISCRLTKAGALLFGAMLRAESLYAMAKRHEAESRIIVGEHLLDRARRRLEREKKRYCARMTEEAAASLELCTWMKRQADAMTEAES